MRRLLLVEDQADSRAALARILEARGFRVEQASNGRAALAIARRERLHGLILELELPDVDGLAVIDGVLENHPRLPTIVMAGSGTVDSAVEAMRHGASDFLTKPIDTEALIASLARTLKSADDVLPTPPSEASAAMEELGMIGRSEAMLDLFDKVRRIAAHPSTILIQGESGTGKELIARALHRLGPRRERPFVAVDCAMLGETLFDRDVFAQAEPGTLFLDRVSEIGLAAQAKLLRALERRDVIATTSVDLDERVEKGTFRTDLYHRLKVVTLLVPPLRERKDAIPILARRFLEDAATRAGTGPKRIHREAMRLLVQYPWPGNVRELKNLMESVTLLVTKPTIGTGDLPQKMAASPRPEIRVAPGMRLDEVEREVIRLNLAAYPTVKDAARALGVPLRTFHDKLKRHRLRIRRPKGPSASR